MKDQPCHLNQTWPVGRKWCSLTNASPQNWGFSPKFGTQKTSNFLPLFRDFRTRHRISPEQNVASTNKNASDNLQCVPKKLTYIPWHLTQKRLWSVCLLWPTLRRPLSCNHHSCDMSSFTYLTLNGVSRVPASLRHWSFIARKNVQCS